MHLVTTMLGSTTLQIMSDTPSTTLLQVVAVGTLPWWMRLCGRQNHRAVNIAYGRGEPDKNEEGHKENSCHHHCLQISSEKWSKGYRRNVPILLLHPESSPRSKFSFLAYSFVDKIFSYSNVLSCPTKQDPRHLPRLHTQFTTHQAFFKYSNYLKSHPVKTYYIWFSPSLEKWTVQDCMLSCLFPSPSRWFPVLTLKFSRHSPLNHHNEFLRSSKTFLALLPAYFKTALQSVTLLSLSLLFSSLSGLYPS